MPLHPQAQALCDLVNAMPSALDSALPEEQQLEQARAGWGLLVAAGGGTPEPVHGIEDLDADGVPVRVYRPSPDGGLPLVVFLHGGGWTIGDVAQYDVVARQLANVSGAIVVSVDYRLAPEHPFPAGLEDCRRALAWVAARGGDLGGDSTRIAVAGDSAGGNLAAVCALEAAEAGRPELALQVLVYPVADCDFERASYRDNGKGYLLEAGQMRWFFDCYTRGGADRSDWRISPLRAANPGAVAPALVITAEYDPLRDEGDAYARHLRDAGVAVEHRRYDGMVHGFFGLSAAFDASRHAMDVVGTSLRRAFGTLDS